MPEGPMNDVERYYESTYVLPHCTFCKQDYLTYNTYKVYQVELFCANENCTAFLKGYWANKKDLEKR